MSFDVLYNTLFAFIYKAMYLLTICDDNYQKILS